MRGSGVWGRRALCAVPRDGRLAFHGFAKHPSLPSHVVFSLSHTSPSLPLFPGLTCILPELLKTVAEKISWTMPRPRQKRMRSIEPEPAPEFENWEELNETTKR